MQQVHWVQTLVQQHHHQNQMHLENLNQYTREIHKQWRKIGSKKDKSDVDYTNNWKEAESTRIYESRKKKNVKPKKTDKEVPELGR